MAVPLTRPVASCSSGETSSPCVVSVLPGQRTVFFEEDPKHELRLSVRVYIGMQAATGATHWDSRQCGSGALALPPQPDLHGHR